MYRHEFGRYFGADISIVPKHTNGRRSMTWLLILQLVRLLKGIAIFENPSTNKGSAFTREERENLSITGLLPDGVDSIDLQRQRVLGHLAAKTTRLLFGTAFIISKMLEKSENERVILNLGVGQIPVTFMQDDRSELWMEQKEPNFGEVIQPGIIAEILHINEADINTSYPIQIVSTGLPAVIRPVKTLDTVRKCVINHEKYQTFLDEVIRANLLVFVPEVQKQGNDLHVRVFMDDKGFFEDPATGSANGNKVFLVASGEWLLYD
jgi:hypothetical protein